MGLADLLLDHPAGEDEPLFCTLPAEHTRAAFVEMVKTVEAQLTGAGVQAGQAVTVQTPDPVLMAAAMFAVWLKGGVYVPVNSRQPVREVEHILATIRPAASIGPDGVDSSTGAAEYPEDTAFVMWTSGTTGPPKPILQTHSGYQEILGTVLESLRGHSQSRPAPNLVPVSLALNAGIYNLLFGLMAGASVVLMDRFQPGDFASLVSRYGIRSTVLPPAAMTALTEEPGLTDLTPLRYVRSITAPLSPLAARRFMDKFGVTVLNGYGQAEIGEVIGWTAADAREHPEKLGAVGRPHPGVAIKVVGERGESVAAGELGELLVKPVRMATGYASGESLSDRIDDGYVRTGDYARIDAEGFVWIEGRKSDLINRGGNKVFPDQVEEVLQLHPRVRECAVVGVPDDRLGEVPVGFVVGDAPTEELLALCRENLIPYKIPVRFLVIDSLPRNDAGKVLRRNLRETVLPPREAL